MLARVAEEATDRTEIDDAVASLESGKGEWANLTVDKRIALLKDVKNRTATVAQQWVDSAVIGKQIPENSPLAGEEWISGPYTLISGCNALIETLSHMEGRTFLSGLKKRKLPNGNLSVEVLPHSIWDRLLLSGVSAEIWMQANVSAQNLKDHTASIYDTPEGSREGGVALVLGAGNIAAIAPLDCLHKLFSENQVVILKLNPINDYLFESLSAALAPLIECDAMKIVKGGGEIGEYLCNHSMIDEIHITGAGATHDAIVWGVGDEADANKKKGTPKNKRRITSELGAVCPTILVPGPWSNADIKFQADHVATQKLHNAGFNCVAMQTLIFPKAWDKGSQFMAALKESLRNAPHRELYYPGADERLDRFSNCGNDVETIDRGNSGACRIVSCAENEHRQCEVFGPAFSIEQLDNDDPETYLKSAIAFANNNLHGTLGANVIIHPKTLAKIGQQRFDELIAELKYGAIAINAWTGLGFLTAQATWGAYPGHTLEDVQSGIGVVHNSYMFDRPERTIIRAPFRPFPRGILSGKFNLLPKPPWFVNNRKGDVLGRYLTDFQAKPSIWKIPGIFLNALAG